MAVTASPSPVPATSERMKRSSRLLGVRDFANASPRVKSISSESSVSNADKVTVCVRFKPSSSPDCYHAYEFSEDGTTLTLSNTHPTVVKRNGKAGREKEYTHRFSGVYLSPEPTLALYEKQIAPLVAKAMAGFNSTIFAYGQTGSGKTHTMSGTSEDVGIIPLAVSGVFEAIEQNPGRQYLLRVSYLEIYNETLRDMLPSSKAPVNEKDRPVIHVVDGNVVVRPLQEEIVRTPEEVLGLLERGQRNRRVGATDWNERSSRSHCVFTMTIESRDGEDLRQSRLSLIDLAGSEKAASNQERLAEGKHINRSLLALGTVIELLSDKNRRPGSHIPYRNSKLTHLLESALGGNANIAVICTLSAETHHSSETLESLKFASRCAQVETQATQGIVASSEKALLQAKEEEISKLREQISTLTSSRQKEAIQEEHDAPEAQHKLHDELELLEERRNRLVEQLRILNSEILSSHSSSSPAVASTIGQLMRRRVSDFIRAHPGKVMQAADPATPSRRAVSSKITLIDEGDSSDNNISSDLFKAYKRQRSVDKEHHNVLLARLTAAESVTAEFQTMKQEVERLKQCLVAESAKSQELMEQLLGRDRLEAQQNRRIRDLESQLSAAVTEGEELKTKRSLSQPAMLPSLNEAGLPLEPSHNKHRTNSPQQKLSDPVTISDRQKVQCSTCELYIERSRTQETIIQGQQSTNRALMEKVGEWQQRVHDQDALIQRLLPKMQQVIQKENTFEEPVKENFAPSTPDKKVKAVERTEPREYGSYYRTHISHNSSSKPYLYNDRPRPLPMTETQESNFSPRGHRRVTIEHDIHKLQSMNRVDKTRSLFLSPDRTSSDISEFR